MEKKKSSHLESLLIGFQRDSQAALGAVNVIDSCEGVDEVKQEDEAADEENRQVDRENSNSQLI